LGLVPGVTGAAGWQVEPACKRPVAVRTPQRMIANAASPDTTVTSAMASTMR